MRKGLSVVLAVGFVLALGTSAMATNGYQLIGIGQIQKSMGGAVTAAPRDSMTAISNPAGMSRIGERSDFSMEAFLPTRSVDFGVNGGGMTEGGTDMYGIPAIGWTAKTSNDDVYFGGGMYGTSGLGVDYGEVVFDGFGDTFNGHSSVMFWKMAPTIAWNVNDKASVGFSLNIDYQSVAITQKFEGPGFAAYPGGMINFDLGRPTSQFGYGFTMGGLYDINKMITVGATYSSKQSFSEGEFNVGTNDILNYNGATGQAGIYKMDLEYPPQLAIGVAIKPMNNLLVAVDFKQIYWSETHDEVGLSGPAGAFNAAFNPTGSTDSTSLYFGWEDQTVIALGVVYNATPDLDISFGYNQADAPIDEADVFNNLVFPAVVETHYTAGVDYKLGNNWGIALTYMKAVSNELVGKGDLDPAMGMGPDSNVKIALEETSVGTQLSYRF